VHVPLRLCLDLNVWCARFFGRRHGRKNTAAYLVIEAVRNGISSLGTVQLVISWGMVNRLRSVLDRDMRALSGDIDDYIAEIIDYAQLGAATGPSLTLGGMGLLPLSDKEDAHVVDTAIAGESDILVTANFKDFLPRHVDIVAPERLARMRHPKGELLIAHPYAARDWLQAGSIALPQGS
jgi:hypothetical protein